MATALREGRNVPLATIAAESGVSVSVGTFTAAMPTGRPSLFHALKNRAYGLLNEILDHEGEMGALALEHCEYTVRRGAPLREAGALRRSRLLTPADIEFAARRTAQLVFERVTLEHPAELTLTANVLLEITQTRRTLTEEMVAQFEQDIQDYARPEAAR